MMEPFPCPNCGEPCKTVPGVSREGQYVKLTISVKRCEKRECVDKWRSILNDAQAGVIPDFADADN